MNKNVTDIIVLLDTSGSMETMNNEPIQAINLFIEQQKNKLDDNATFTLVQFNTDIINIIDEQLLSSVTPLSQESYIPYGLTCLNDAICTTINSKLLCVNNNNKVLVIITDGAENGSFKFSKNDVKNSIKLVEDKHNWKVVFMGSNIDSFVEGIDININKNRCSQFYQEKEGDLSNLCRQASEDIYNYRRMRSNGSEDNDLILIHSDSHSDSHSEPTCELDSLDLPPITFTKLTRHFTDNF